MDQNQSLQNIKQLIQSAESSLEAAKNLLQQLTNGVEPVAFASLQSQAKEMGSMASEGESRIINGVFDGQHMIGPDGKQYSVPANYASKSKLVEGDMLKLTIMHDGSFVYKQIGPVDRSRVIGKLLYDDMGEEWKVDVSGKVYSVLLASVTYFKGELGDEVVLLVPKGREANWGAVENIIKKGQAYPADMMQEPVAATDVQAEESTNPQASSNELEEI